LKPKVCISTKVQTWYFEIEWTKLLLLRFLLVKKECKAQVNQIFMPREKDHQAYGLTNSLFLLLFLNKNKNNKYSKLRAIWLGPLKFQLTSLLWLQSPYNNSISHQIKSSCMSFFHTQKSTSTDLLFNTHKSACISQLSHTYTTSHYN